VLVVENGVAHSRKITEIRDLGTEVEISDGVKQGDQVVLSPPVDLDDGSKVRSGCGQSCQGRLRHHVNGTPVCPQPLKCSVRRDSYAWYEVQT
jgi:hypothetical protein